MPKWSIGLLVVFYFALPAAQAAGTPLEASQALNRLAALWNEVINDPKAEEIRGEIEEVWIAQRAHPAGASWERFNRLKNDFVNRYQPRFLELGAEFASVFPEDVKADIPIGKTRYVMFEEGSPLHWLIGMNCVFAYYTDNSQTDFKMFDDSANVRRYLPQLAWRVYALVTRAIEADPVYLALDIESATAFETVAETRRSRSPHSLDFPKLNEARNAFLAKYGAVFKSLSEAFALVFPAEVEHVFSAGQTGRVEFEATSLAGRALEWDRGALAIDYAVAMGNALVDIPKYRPFSEIAREVRGETRSSCSDYLHR